MRPNQRSAEVPGGKYSKGEKAGQYSCNPLGKNPGDIWTIPNVKHNHVEKTIHPCQFPIELVERLVLALTNFGDLVLDPYIGAGSAACAAVLHGRRAAGADTSASLYFTHNWMDQAAAAVYLPQQLHNAHKAAVR